MNGIMKSSSSYEKNSIIALFMAKGYNIIPLVHAKYIFSVSRLKCAKINDNNIVIQNLQNTYYDDLRNANSQFDKWCTINLRKAGN